MNGRRAILDHMKYCLFLAAISMWAQTPATIPAPKPSLASPAFGAARPLAPAQVAPDAVILTVGDEKVTRAQFERIMASVPENQRAQFSSPAGKKRLAEQLVELKAMAHEARTEKLEEDPLVKAEIALRIDQALAQRLFQTFLETSKPDDAALRAYYDQHKNDWEQVKAKHILIRFKGSGVPVKTGEKDRTDEEALALANDLHSKIVAGANFDELAKANSDDTGNANSGGELGAFGRGRMVPQFEKAAFAAEVGKVTEPVKSQFGYHLILVEEHKTKPFEEVRAEIAKKIEPEIAQKKVAELKKNTPVVLDESYFGK
jgi:peptidyl-prolyl cis-trans isomerase C